MSYAEFLVKKERLNHKAGFEVSASSLHSSMKAFQKFSTLIALDKGRFALFEDCGLGKTFQQLVWADKVCNYTNRPVLILAPFAVVGQTIEEGKKFRILVQDLSEAIANNDIENCTNGIYVTNYEQLPQIINYWWFENFAGIAIDESSILKNFEGSYRNLIIDCFRNTRFKLACSATPSPNDPMELGNHAEFLGVMNRNEMLATYFVHDGGETSKWRLKGHAVDKFWKWVNSWCLMFSRPSDIGFDDEGYILPELRLIENKIITSLRADGNILNNIAVSATNFHKELRLTKVERLSQVVEIVNGSDESFIVWVNQDEEGEYLRKNLKGAIEVSGKDKPELKRKNLLDFQKDAFRVLITKPKIASFGLNYQNCHNMVFASPDFSFEKLYQSIRRELRYGQKNTVNVYLITTDTMENVLQAIKRKQRQQEEMQKQISKHTKELYAKYYSKVG